MLHNAAMANWKERKGERQTLITMMMSRVLVPLSSWAFSKNETPGANEQIKLFIHNKFVCVDCVQASPQGSKINDARYRASLCILQYLVLLLTSLAKKRSRERIYPAQKEELL